MSIFKRVATCRKRISRMMASAARNSSSYTLRRSALYMPASNSRALEKAKSLNADAFIFDLEDAVAADMKHVAREQAVAAANRHRDENIYGRSSVVIRVNGIGTPWFKDDVEMVSRSGADAILLPKASSAQDVMTLREAIIQNGGRDDLNIWCMIETPLGVLNAADIAADDAVACLCMGTVDLANDLRCDSAAKHRWNLQFALQTCVAAARAYDKVALDSVYIDIRNDDGFREECTQGRALGFDGKTVIHPKMIDVTNSAFSPSEEEISSARRIIEAHSDAVSSGSGVATLDGKLVEELHVRGARRVLSIADAVENDGFMRGI